MQQPVNRIILIAGVGILLVLYSMGKSVAKQLEDDDTSVSLCQVRARSDDAIVFEDQTLLSLLSVLKMNDFRIGQPVWGPSDTVLYLCEHRLKVGVKYANLNRELNAIIKYAGASSRYLAWTCV